MAKAHIKHLSAGQRQDILARTLKSALLQDPQNSELAELYFSFKNGRPGEKAHDEARAVAQQLIEEAGGMVDYQALDGQGQKEILRAAALNKYHESKAELEAGKLDENDPGPSHWFGLFSRINKDTAPSEEDTRMAQGLINRGYTGRDEDSLVDDGAANLDELWKDTDRRTNIDGRVEKIEPEAAERPGPGVRDLF